MRDGQASCSFLTGGDVAPVTVAGKGMFGDVAPLFAAADLSFLNLEHPLTGNGPPVPGKRFLHHGRPDHIEGFLEAKVGAINLANNHMLDFGEPALLTTLDLLKKNGFPYFGAGVDLDSAAQAVVLSKGGISLGLIGCTSTLGAGFPAETGKPGVNPIRVRTAYRPPPNLDDLPGTAPVIETWPVPSDLQRLVDSVRSLKQRVDVVLVYVHWGSSITGQVHEHQRTIGRAVIDAGASGVFGGHQHVVSAIEFHDGKPIVHCTGDLVFDVIEPWFGGSTERNILFGATMTKAGLEDCYVHCCRTGIDHAAALERPNSEVGQKILSDLRLYSEPYGTTFEVSGDRILVVPGAAQPSVPRFGASLHPMGLPLSPLAEGASPGSSALDITSGDRYRQSQLETKSASA